jgi:hypothetical protein
MNPIHKFTLSFFKTNFNIGSHNTRRFYERFLSFMFYNQMSLCSFLFHACHMLCPQSEGPS